MSEIVFNTTGFNNYGFLSAKFSEEDILPIKTEINKIKQQFDLFDARKHNSNLAGNIMKEYTLLDSKKYAEHLIIPLLKEYDKQFNYVQNYNYLLNPAPIELDTFWVNFQKKYEFNPIHKHDGIFSFVIWVNVPYNIEDEQKLGPGINSNYNSAGGFSLLYADAIGGILSHDIVVDKSKENTIVIFPSKFHHCVYPFFSSDDYRISVSGNFKLRV